MPRTPAELEATVDFKLQVASSLPQPLSQADRVALTDTHRGMYRDGTPLLHVRDAVIAQKSKLDAFDDAAYHHVRDRIFPLAHSGVSDRRARFSNRAGHKLNQAMTQLGMWDAVTVLRRGQPASSHRTEAAEAPTCGAEDPENVVRRRSVTFVDICGGPGAFSQALFQTAPKKVKVRGFGLTLMDRHVGADAGWYPQLTKRRDFAVSFGVDGRGDIYNPANVECFCSLANGGVDAGAAQLAVADGGFEVPPSQQNLQEALSARLVYAQWYVATRTLAPGGSFVLKLFDTFTDFTRSLLYLSCHAFEAAHIVKPLHSRAVNSERYLACNGFRGLPPAWMTFLEWVHARGFSDTHALVSLVPLETMRKDTAFDSSVNTSVERIADAQIEALQLVIDGMIENARNSTAADHGCPPEHPPPADECA
eukprot:CAMPEP_0174831628 /NCGR_PEP_ID=MMETSP1114-20130205/3208_1 /TAXON_ID=312471 /ORGANISM="Neobodo designis, Strain CCAP 1951/1" /LENGTH=421 /DNA_ID=CAMNT_0016065459 /DNA_START=30 /DNA_END=1292 /DNA_ORIENTATION=-